MLRQSSDNQVNLEFFTSRFLAHLYEEPLTLVVAPDLVHETPLLILVAALAGTVVVEAATRTAAPNATRVLRYMKTSIEYGSILASSEVDMLHESRENRVNYLCLIRRFIPTRLTNDRGAREIKPSKSLYCHPGIETGFPARASLQAFATTSSEFSHINCGSPAIFIRPR